MKFVKVTACCDMGDDVRCVITRFSDANMAANEPLLALVESFAARKGCTSRRV